MRISLLLLVIVAAAAIYALVTPVVAIVVGGWKPVPITGPHVQELGRWAVTEHVKLAKDGLKFWSVVSAGMQVADALRHRLTIAAVKDRKNGKYLAVIAEGLTEKRVLVSFNVAN